MLRRLRCFTSVTFCACVVATSVLADNGRHGLSAFGDLKYPADFAHFGWVNPDAPKGGRIATIGTGALTTFDSFNNFILKGDPAQGLELLFDSLMTRATDEPDAVYALVARSAELAADRKSVTFRLRSEAKFADGSALTADDVVFTFATLKQKGHPNYRVLLRDVSEAQALDQASVRFSFTGTQIRDLPLTVASLPILSKAFYANREFEQTTRLGNLAFGEPYAAQVITGTPGVRHQPKRGFEMRCSFVITLLLREQAAEEVVRLAWSAVHL